VASAFLGDWYGFGAELPFAALLEAEDQRTAALGFLRARLAALAG
jgi:hypothetical protein